jgi:hypothetical protein
VRSPCLFYAKALALQPGSSAEDVTQRLADEGLDPVPLPTVDAYCHLGTPWPYHPYDPTHLPSYRFLASERVVRFYHPDDAYRHARRILETPRAREVCETLILSRAPHAEITRLLAHRFQWVMSPEAVPVFAHFFWNMEAVDITEVRLLLQVRHERLLASAGSAATETGKDIAVKRSYEMDPRRIAAQLPASPATARLALAQAGLPLGDVAFADTLRAIRDTAALRALEAVQLGGRNGAEAVLGYMGAVRQACDMLGSIDTPEQGIAESIRKLRLRTEQTDTPLLHQLGEHTVEMLPAKDTSSAKPEGEVL